ncbi:GyrI-like domain-containing protein [Bacillus gaemokensis]|uniref:GyrI-like domain-containing protein n=1 Tax=Bacillus gaemokensis TaxID=574375 RepID=UPI002AA0CF9B|nr:GyrI-like domain-containing protein [Bacillus gaemokensis]
MNIPAKKIVGIKKETTFEKDPEITRGIWQTFMPIRNSILHRANSCFLSVKVLKTPLNMNDMNYAYQKWAAVEVESFDKDISLELSKHTLAGGLYAVFIHKGTASDMSTFQYIFQEWLPNSNYNLDVREHFEVMDDTYRPDDINAKEEVWISIKMK